VHNSTVSKKPKYGTPLRLSKKILLEAVQGTDGTPLLPDRRKDDRDPEKRRQRTKNATYVIKAHGLLENEDPRPTIRGKGISGKRRTQGTEEDEGTFWEKDLLLTNTPTHVSRKGGNEKRGKAFKLK